ncbi:MAG: hypothetical protein II917_03955 [Synergistaceae bacterium]|nr:hypothetical protein [Synergistaceae bacterium]
MSELTTMHRDCLHFGACARTGIAGNKTCSVCPAYETDYNEKRAIEAIKKFQKIIKEVSS